MGVGEQIRQSLLHQPAHPSPSSLHQLRFSNVQKCQSTTREQVGVHQNPKTPRIWGFHFCHHLRMAKTGTLLTCTYFALPPSALPVKSGRGPRPARHCKTTATRRRITASRSGKTIEYASTAALNVLGRFLKPKLCPPACWLALSWRGVAAPHVVLLRLPGSPQDVPDSSGRAF